ncbi:hypothetical protein T01_8097, partial [Trichinella spiralis]
LPSVVGILRNLVSYVMSCPFKIGNLFPPVNKNTIVKHYVPCFGLLCNYAFAAEVMNPGILPRVHDLSDPFLKNGLLLGTGVGLACYFWTREHLKGMELPRRCVITSYGASVFSLSSVLLLSLAKAAFPDCVAVRAILGLIIPTVMILVGKCYTTYLDRLVSGKRSD